MMQHTGFLTFLPLVLVRSTCFLPSTAGQPLARPLAEPDNLRVASRVLALVGLLIGTMLLAIKSPLVAWPPPDVPSMVARVATSQPLAMALQSASFLVLSQPRASYAAVLAPRVLLRDSLVLADNNVADDSDDSSSMMRLTAGDFCLPPSPPMGIDSLQNAFLWPFHYFARPQLLTRF
jgi:hypothetical protein